MQALVVVVQLAADRATRAIKRYLLYATITAPAMGTMSCIITHTAAIKALVVSLFVRLSLLRRLLLRSILRRELILTVNVKLSSTIGENIGAAYIFICISKVVIAIAHLVRSFQHLKSPAKTISALLQFKQADPPSQPGRLVLNTRKEGVHLCTEVHLVAHCAGAWLGGLAGSGAPVTYNIHDRMDAFIKIGERKGVCVKSKSVMFCRGDAGARAPDLAPAPSMSGRLSHLQRLFLADGGARG
jgi:hypothetical protein